MVLPQISNLAQEGEEISVNLPLEYSTVVTRIHFWFGEIHLLGKGGSVGFTKMNISDDSQPQDSTVLYVLS